MADKEAYGFLFPKKDREAGQPNLTGNAMLNGRQVQVAAWTKTSKGGSKYLSLKFSDYEVDATGVVPEAAEEDIPF